MLSFFSSDLEQHETNLSKPSSTSCEEKQLNDCTAEVDKPGCEDKSIAPEPHECKKPSTLQPSGKRQSAASKKEPVSVVPDLEEEQVFQDYAMLGVSVVAALAGATLNNCPLYDFICFPRADECQQVGSFKLIFFNRNCDCLHIHAYIHVPVEPRNNLYCTNSGNTCGIFPGV